METYKLPDMMLESGIAKFRHSLKTDSETQKLTYCGKSYQQLLLKTSVPNHQMAFTNNFMEMTYAQ